MIRLQDRIPGRKHKDVFALIHKRGVVSKQELLESGDWTGSTLTRTLEELTSGGLIEEAGFGESTGGRRPILYRSNPEYGYVFGLDISRMHSMLVLYDMHLNKLDSQRWMMTDTMTPDVFIELVEGKAEAMLASRGIRPDSVIGMGIGAVGPLDRDSGTILEPLYFPAPGWRNVEIAPELEARLSIPVKLDNGANTALLGEQWASREQQYQHVLYIHVGVGLRSSVMVGGKVVYGAVDMEGAIGQMIIQADGPRMNAEGNYGSLEAYASIHALEQHAIRSMKLGRESILSSLCEDPEKLQYSHLLEALGRRDSLSIELFTQAASYFGVGLANLLNILHPEKVILGGPLIASDPLFFQTCTRIAVRNAYYYPAYQVMFSRGALGDEALVTGAAAMMIDAMTV
ncbi:ROK family protein [Paenibacillus chartarius]|uniref:ROK family protein n=1 Tax=Paenibacillus chartarius TaxID=747481 RepID=A0ABV6DMP6_9BACL